MSWKSKKIGSKSRWNSDKIDKYLEDGIDGKLSKSDIQALREEIILFEVEQKNKELTSQIKVSYMVLALIMSTVQHPTIQPVVCKLYIYIPKNCVNQ